MAAQHAGITIDERPGPVHFDVPADQTRAECAGAGEGSLSEYQRTYGPAANLEQAAKFLRSAQRPLVVAGNTARRRAASSGVRQLAEARGMPVVTTPKAKGVIDEGHPLWAGVIEMAGRHFMDDFLAQADLILAVGFDPVELIAPWRHSAPVIHIDYLPNTDDVYYSALDLVGDIDATCEAIASSSQGESRWSAAELARHRTEYLRRVTVQGSGLSPSAVVLAAREALPESAIMISDVGSHKMLLGGLWRNLDAGHLLHVQWPRQHGLRPPLRDSRPAGASRQEGRLLHRRRRHGDGTGRTGHDRGPGASPS